MDVDSDQKHAIWMNKARKDTNLLESMLRSSPSYRISGVSAGLQVHVTAHQTFPTVRTVLP